jgi:hypothetical protein
MNAVTRYTAMLGAGVLLSTGALASPALASGSSLAPAHFATATVRGTVISKDLHRHTFVVATAAGAVRTVRTNQAILSRVRPGEKIGTHATLLADGTYTSSVVTRAGHVSRARVRATVVGTNAGKILLSAGGSVFAVSSVRAASQLGAGAGIGQTVDATVGISQSGLDQISVRDVGQSNLISLDGVLSAVTSSSITVAIEDGASTTVAVPASITVPSTIAVGDSVEILVDYSNQTFSLVTIKDDSLTSNNQGQGTSEGDNQSLQVEGQVIAVSATSITVQPGDQASAVTLSVPSSVDVSAIIVGDSVQAEGVLTAGVLTLSSIEVQEGDSQGSGDQVSSEITGTVTALSGTSVTVSSTDSLLAITAAIPASFNASVFVLGGSVHLTTEVIAGITTVTQATVEGA